MTRGPLFASGKILAEIRSKAGGSVPVAKIFLPELSSALPIRLMMVSGDGRRIAEARPRRPT